MDKIKLAVIGLGKMGLSHLSIAGAHPSVELVAAVDTATMVTDFLQKFSDIPCFNDTKKMLEQVTPDAVIIAVPTKYHAPLIQEFLKKNIHVFAEKPFTLSAADANRLTELAASKKLVNQVGYHNQFLGTFKELKKLLQIGAIGKLQHFTAEAYGPVITKPQPNTWRSNASEGGGCLYDYASHVLDLVNNCIAPVTEVKGSLLKNIYSAQTEDAVYSLLGLSSGLTGVLSVNWSDTTYRKMSTQLTITGSNGKIICEATELKLFLQTPVASLQYTEGWNILSVGELQEPVNFYLRGEEYSAQLDYFIAAVKGLVPNTINTFAAAALTDNAIELIKKSAK